MATIGNDTEQYSDTYGYFRVITNNSNPKVSILGFKQVDYILQ